jgi:hypothetical protein
MPPSFQRAVAGENFRDVAGTGFFVPYRNMNADLLRRFP